MVLSLVISLSIYESSILSLSTEVGMGLKHYLHRFCSGIQYLLLIHEKGI